MRYWLVAFAIALVVVLGYAVGPLGVLIAAFAFGAALFLLWADQLGFGDAWTAFGFDQFDAPFSAPEILDRLASLVQDRDKSVKALTIALALIALWRILPGELMLIGIIALIGWSAQRIYARRTSSPGMTAARPQASALAASSAPVASPLPPKVAWVDHLKPMPAALNVAVEPVHPQPVVSSILLAPAASSEIPATSTATISFMVRGRMSSASSLALLARARYRKPRVRRGPKRLKRPSKSRTSRKATRHVPLHLKLPQGRRSIRRPKRPLQSGPKLPSRQTRKAGD